MPDPERLWEIFNNRTSSPAGSYLKRLRPYTQRERHQRRVDPATEEAINQNSVNATILAKTLQRWWKRVRTSNDLYPVSVKSGNHLDEFYNLVSCVGEGDNLKKLLNIEILNELLSAMTIGDWNADVISNPLLPQAALSLFASEKITRQQMSTLLELVQLKNIFKTNMPLALLDQVNGQFTEHAINGFFPILFKYPPFNQINTQEEMKETFRLLLNKLPRSEQFVWFCRDLLESSHNKSWFKLDKMGARYSEEDSYEAYFHGGQREYKIFHIGAGARDALGIARFGVERYIPEIHRLGRLTIDDIEEGMRGKNQIVRHGTVRFPGVDTNNNIHGKTDVIPYEVTCHDFYHSLLCSSIPPTLHKALDRLVDIVRTQTGQKWSTAIWALIDRELHYHPEARQTPSNDLTNFQEIYRNMKKTYYPGFFSRSRNLEDVPQSCEEIASNILGLNPGYTGERSWQAALSSSWLTGENGQLFFLKSAPPEFINDFNKLSATNKIRNIHGYKIPMNMTAPTEINDLLNLIDKKKYGDTGLGISFFNDKELSDIGILLLVDIVINEREWVTLNITPEVGEGDWKKHYDDIKSMRQYLDDDPKKNIIKFRISASLADDEKISDWAQVVDNADHTLMNKIKFKRDNTKDFLGLKYKEEDNWVEIDGNHYKKLFSPSNDSMLSHATLADIGSIHMMR